MVLPNEGNINKKVSPPQQKTTQYPNNEAAAPKTASGPVAPPPPPPPRHGGGHPFSHFFPGGVPMPVPPPPSGYDPEAGHRGPPGPYTAAQYEKSRGVPLPPFGGPPPPPPHAAASRGSAGSAQTHPNRGRDPPPPLSHYPPIHGAPHPPGADRPPGHASTAYPQMREEHRPPHWPGYARPPFPAPGAHPQPYPPPPPPADHVHPPVGPYRYSDSSLRREATSRISQNANRFEEVDIDGREGATSPSQIETSHREEVTTMGCTCKKTKCLKLYCQCFAVKIYCGGNCRCLICRNTQKFEKERKDAIRNILARNPTAFDTKFKKTADGRVIIDKAVPDRTLAHKLGCKCRKSACMKKYCECYAGNVKCSANCRCVGCKNTPRGGLPPPSVPPGASTLTTMRPGVAVARSSSEEDADGSPTGKRREPWMMNAAHNLAFLKHASPSVQKQTRAKQTRARSIETSTDVGSMPSLASEESSSPSDNRRKEEAPKLETASSSEKTAVNALLMAAMAMTEMSSKNDEVSTPPRSNKGNDIKMEAEEEEYKTPQKNLLSKFNSPKRKQSDTEYRSHNGKAQLLNGDASPSEDSSDEDSPKRDYPGGNTPHSNQQKIKRTRLGSHKKLPRNLGSELEHQKLASSVLNGLSGSAMSTPKNKGQNKMNDLTPVSARCIDFRNMHVNEANATETQQT